MKRALVCLFLGGALMGCQQKDHPPRLKFVLPAYEQMPASEILLQYEDLPSAPASAVSTALVNAVYLSVRGCPDVHMVAGDGEALSLLMRVREEGIDLSSTGGDPGRLEGGECLRLALKDKKIGLNAVVSATVFFKRSEGADSP